MLDCVRSDSESSSEESAARRPWRRVRGALSLSSSEKWGVSWVSSGWEEDLVRLLLSSWLNSSCADIMEGRETGFRGRVGFV